jgi:purine-binding chemotaxis protein CheW
VTARRGLQVVSFTLEERRYGLDVRIVKEINPIVDVTPVPLAPRFIRGLVNIRGQVVLVMDLAVIFGRRPRPVTEGSRIVILKTAAELKSVRAGAEVDVELGDKPVGLLVDGIDDVVGVAGEAIEPVPPHLEASNARFFDGVVRLGDDLLMILDAREVLVPQAGGR